MKKVQLDIVGLSYSQTQSGAYALVLGEVNGRRRLPIIIGAFEAQAIAIEIEKMTPTRPLTHDLFKTFAQTYHIEIREVLIHTAVYAGVPTATASVHAAGPWLRYRGHLENISGNLFLGAVNAFTGSRGLRASQNLEQQMAEMIKQMWDTVGIRTTLEVLERTAWISTRPAAVNGASAGGSAGHSDGDPGASGRRCWESVDGSSSDRLRHSCQT